MPEASRCRQGGTEAVGGEPGRVEAGSGGAQGRQQLVLSLWAGLWGGGERLR